MKVLINPRMGWGNSPAVVIYSPYPENGPEHLEHTRSDDGTCYWYQNEMTGLTTFLCNSSPLREVSPNHWEATQRSEGFGGRIFDLRVAGLGHVKLYGAWSGGPHSCNQYLPKPTIDVFFPRSGRVGYLTLEKINQALEMQGSKWRAVETTGPWLHNDGYWVECFHDGVRKELMSKEQLKILQDEHDTLKAAMYPDVRVPSMYVPCVY